jgi:hypothetical protein
MTCIESFNKKYSLKIPVFAHNQHPQEALCMCILRALKLCHLFLRREEFVFVRMYLVKYSASFSLM